MKLLILFGLLSYTSGEYDSGGLSSCADVPVHVQYSQDHPLHGIDEASMLAVDYTHMILYYSYGKDSKRSARLNLTSSEHNDIDGIKDGYAHAVDQETHNVYIGGDGLYKYNPSDEAIQFLGDKGTSVGSVFYKDDIIYYTDFNTKELFTFKDGKKEKFEGLKDSKVDRFFIDNDGNWIFANFSGVYVKKQNEESAVEYMKLSEGPKDMSMHENGLVVIGLNNGIYSVNQTTASMEKLFDFDKLYGLSLIDVNGNMVFSDSNTIYRLYKSYWSVC